MKLHFYILHTYALGQDLSMHAKMLTPVTLTLTSKSVFRFQNLRLSFEKLIIAPIPIEGSLLYLAHKCLLTRPLHRHQNF